MDKANEKTKVQPKKVKPLPLYAVILKEELSRRHRANPHYSLRSFAKQVDIDASLLSKILKNQRKLTAENGKKIIKKCQMSAADKKLFWTSLVQEREQTFGTYDEVSNEFDNEPKAIQEHLLPNDTFHLISNPEHYVLTELTRTKDFKSDVPWIAKKLKLSTSGARDTLDRLLKVGMIQKNGNTYVRSPGRYTTADKAVSDSALKHHQRKVLEGAIRALGDAPLEIRSQNSMTVAINPKKIPLAKQMIQDFINQLTSVMESGSLEEVYQISISLFPSEYL